MRKVYYILFIALLAFSFSEQDTIQYHEIAKKDTPSFNAGEEITFSVKLGFIKGGEASLKLSNSSINGKRVLHAKATAYSTGLTDRIYKVKDIYESYFGAQDGLPIKAVRDISEGGYRFYNETFFNHEDSIVTSKKSGEYKVPAHTIDMVSCLYYLRRLDYRTVRKEQMIHFSTFFADEIYPFDIRYKGVEIVKTEFGKIACHRFDPVTEVGRVFSSEEDMSIWITADENLLPVKVSFDMIVASLHCELIDYKNVKHPIQWIED